MNRKFSLPHTLGAGVMALTLALAGCVANEVPDDSSNSSAPANDQDGDNITDVLDNCPLTSNSNQLDADLNGIGDLCEAGGTPPPLTACSTDSPQTFVPLTSPDATVLTGKTGAIDPVLLTPCADCSVSNPGNVIDSDPSSVATMTVPQAATGQLFLQVNANQVITAGNSVGVSLARPGQTLSLALLQNVTIETYLGGSLQESVTPLLSPAAILVDTLNSTDAKLLRFDASKNFDRVRISVNGLNPDTLNVFATCIAAPNQP